METLSECRQALGGLGFSHYACIGQMMNNGDVNQTFEGDNNVMLMQTARFIIRNLNWMVKGKKLQETCEFLTVQDPSPSDFDGELTIKKMYKLLQKRAKDKAMEGGQELSADPTSWDRCQPFIVREMTEAYNDLYLALTYKDFLATIEDEKVKAAFIKLHELYLKKKIIGDGDYFREWLSAAQFKQLKTDVLDLCAALRPDALALTMVVPTFNQSLGPFGNEDLQGYDRFLQCVLTEEGSMQNAPWWPKAYMNAE